MPFEIYKKYVRPKELVELFGELSEYWKNQEHFHHVFNQLKEKAESDLEENFVDYVFWIRGCRQLYDLTVVTLSIDEDPEGEVKDWAAGFDSEMYSCGYEKMSDCPRTNLHIRKINSYDLPDGFDTHGKKRFRKVISSLEVRVDGWGGHDMFDTVNVSRRVHSLQNVEVGDTITARCNPKVEKKDDLIFFDLENEE